MNMSDVRNEPIQATAPGPSLEEVLNNENVRAAWKAVKATDGAPGVDGMDVQKTAEHLRKHGQEIWEKVRQGTYIPGAILAVEIPKANGGTRKLGIPNVQDRLIQQALHQVLSLRWEPLFSNSSYGFRPNRSAHDAIRRAREIVMSGRIWVVDIDLKSFFDEVNHDILMRELRKEVTDKRILKLIGRYLTAPMVEKRRHSDQTNERHAARRPSVATAGEHLSDPVGPRTGEAATAVYPIRGRRGHLCRKPPRGRTHSVRYCRVDRDEAENTCQSGQEQKREK